MKAYRCELCDYATKWPSNLAAHRRRHAKAAAGGVASSAKPFQCSVCARSYTSAAALARHAACHRLALANPNLSHKYAAAAATSPKKRRKAILSPLRASPEDKVAAERASRVVASLVEEVHAERQGRRNLSQAWAEPMEALAAPATLQGFVAELSGEGLEEAGPLRLYLPLPKLLAAPAQLGLKLTPLPPTEAPICSL